MVRGAKGVQVLDWSSVGCVGISLQLLIAAGRFLQTCRVFLHPRLSDAFEAETSGWVDQPGGDLNICRRPRQQPPTCSRSAWSC